MSYCAFSLESRTISLMEPHEKHRVPFFPALARHMVISLLVFMIVTPAVIFMLYMWANSLGTCAHRPSFTLLSMLEQSVPALMHPIQRLVCPH